MNLAELIARHRHRLVSMFEPPLTRANTVPIDLSASNREFDGLIGLQWDRAIKAKIERAGAIAAVGGYLEQRSMYADTPHFEGDEDRNLHLGLDVFMPAGSILCAPLAGEICCFANRQQAGDYGPVILLRHQLDGIVFHSLYGHLAESSLQRLERGMPVAAGAPLAEIGARPRNGDWPPHLHFQLIRDLQGLDDDYPGVARTRDLEYYRRNCPDPGIFILGEPITVSLFAGTILVVTGVYLTNKHS